MAAQEENQGTTLTLKVVVGTKEDGTPKTGNRTISSINPDVTNDQLYSIGTKLGALQTHEVNAIMRTNRADLVSDE